MEWPTSILIAYLVSLIRTVCGVLFWLSMQNTKEHTNRFILILLLSVFLTPLGAWAVTTIYRFGEVKKPGSTNTAT